MPGGGPLIVANDAALEAAGFRSFVPFHGGMLRLTGDVTTSRDLSLLIGGGTIDTNGFSAIIEGHVINDGTLTKIGAGTLTLLGTSTHAARQSPRARFSWTARIRRRSYHRGRHARRLGVGGQRDDGFRVLAPGGVIPGAPLARPPRSYAQVTMAAGVEFIVELNGTVAGTMAAIVST